MSATDLTYTMNAPMIAGKRIEKSLVQSPSILINKVVSNSTLQKHNDYREFQERFQKTLANKFVAN